MKTFRSLSRQDLYSVLNL